MKKIIGQLLICAAFILTTTSCLEDHNEAPNEGVNLNSERIYGIDGGKPRQLDNEYPEPTEETLERIEKIKEKMFPR
jgi:hypothetical protein